ncbi:MAG: DUF1559 domain-containing protein [Planctomycetaceae bacterium]|nr:DUF1559 domain-containing protein [Planctomycetaceae bacterium]
MSRIFHVFLVTTLLSIGFSLEATAQEHVPAEKLESCLTDSTLGFARVRLDRLDFTSLEQLAKKSFEDLPRMNKRIEASLAPVRQVRQQFVHAGVTEFSVVFDLEYIRFGPYLLIRHREDADPEQIGKLIQELAQQSGIWNGKIVTPFADYLFAGDPLILEHLKAGHTAPRPHLAAALESVDAAAVQVVYCPTDDQLRAIRETVPPLPPLGDRIDGVKLADGIQFATIGLQLQPAPGVSLRILSQNEETAELVKQVQHDSLNQVAELTQKMMQVPGFDKIVRSLKLERTGTELALNFQLEEPQNLEPLVQLVKPILDQQLASVRYNELKISLKQLGIAMHNWHSKYNVFPAHANYSQDEKPLLSWRVHLLPYVDNRELYEQFHLDEPWDSPHNKPLIKQMPDFFKVPGSTVGQEGKTGYVFPILPDGSAITTGTKNGIQIQEIIDGTSNTALITIADDEHSVIWTKPDDLVIDPENPLKGLLRWKLSDGESVIPATFADGSVRSLPANIDPELWLKMLTRAGKEVIEFP